MNLKVNFFELIFILLLLAIAGTCVYAQDKPITTTPLQEKFKNDDGLVERASNAGTKRVIDMDGSETGRIYNQDGSLWYEFKYNATRTWVNKPNDLKPLWEHVFLIFRVKSSSKNWYEVIVNEETGLTKYVSKFDEALGCGDFHWKFVQSVIVKFDREKNPLREKPDGEIIKDEVPNENEKYQFKKLEGDWVQVKLKIAQTFGWVRWRENRKIMVGYILNNFEVPK
jgi:hypothetical protein